MKFFQKSVYLPDLAVPQIVTDKYMYSINWLIAQNACLFCRVAFTNFQQKLSIFICLAEIVCFFGLMVSAPDSGSS